MIDTSASIRSILGDPKRCWVVVPAYNESREIGRVLDNLVAEGCCVVAVDDGSTDKTYEIAKERRVHLLRHVLNLGQGAALSTGIQYALNQGAEFIVTFDGDGQHSVAEIPDMLRPVALGNLDVALGTRFGPLAKASSIPKIRKFVLLVAAWWARASTGLIVSDTHNGLRAFNANAAAKLGLKQDRMAHASEILEVVAREGLRYTEVDVSIEYTRYSLAKGQKLSNSINILWDWILGKVR